MFGPSIADIPYVFAFGVGFVLIAWALTMFVVEMRRVGSTPWSEVYNDKLVPLYRSPRRRQRSTQRRSIRSQQRVGQSHPTQHAA